MPFNDYHSAECRSQCDQSHAAKCHRSGCHFDCCHFNAYHSVECHSVECHSVKCHSVKCHSVECHSVECRSVECHSVVCRSVECRGTFYSITTTQSNFDKTADEILILTFSSSLHYIISPSGKFYKTFLKSIYLIYVSKTVKA